MICQTPPHAPCGTPAGNQFAASIVEELQVQPLLVGVELLVIFHHIAINKNTRQLEIQRLPGMNAAKIGIISESCKYFAMFFVFVCSCVAFYFDFEDLRTKST